MTKNEIIIIFLLCSLLGITIIPYAYAFTKFIFKKTKFRKLGQSSQIRLVRQLNDAISVLSKERTGAIITVVNKQKIDDLRTDGIILDAKLSSQLILSIFNKHSPIHDGAIVIDNNKIKYAGTYYKITSESVDNKYGARHRAAFGISEQSDALTIVVSEETGSISFIKERKLTKIKMQDLQEKIQAYLK